MRRQGLGAQPPGEPWVINRASPQAQGLVSWWPELASRGTKTLRDVVGVRNGALTGDAAIVGQSEFGQITTLDGTGDYADIGGSAVGAADYTVSLWAMTTTPATRQAIFADWDSGGTGQSVCIEFGGYQQTAGTINAVLRWGASNSTYIKSSITAAANTWYQIAVSYRNSTRAVELSVNGILRSAPTLSSTQQVGTSLSLGRAGAYNGLYLIGGVRDARIYNRVLTAPEIYALYDPATRWDLYEPVRRVWTAGEVDAAPETGRKYGPVAQMM